MALVCAMHITAGVWINDDEPGLQADALEWLDKVAPPSWHEPDGEVARELLPNPGDYRHHRGGEDNGDAHLKNLLVHHQVIVPVTDGELDLGPWQQIFYCEFDGRRPEATRDQGARGVTVDVLARVRRRRARGTGRDRHRRRHEPRQGGGGRARALRRLGGDRGPSRRRARGRRRPRSASAARWVAGGHPRTGRCRADRQTRRSSGIGRLDLLLNNAGGQYMVPAEDLATKGWRAVQRLNVDGTLAMCTAAYELAMRDAGAGTIVNVTVSPHHGMPAMAHTGAARAAVEAITRELASAYGRERHLGDRGRARAVRHRVAAQVPGRAVAERRRDRPAPAARERSRSTAG